VFETAEKTEKLLNAKAAYYREALLEPHGSEFVSSGASRLNLWVLKFSIFCRENFSKFY
jgi:hypothetical protein